MGDFTLDTGHGDLISALQTIAQGGVYYPEPIRRLAAPESPRADLPELIEALTPRELEVFGAVARGLKNNAIADYLGVSLETVKTHVGNAMDKLAARYRTQMAVTALLYGLIDPLDKHKANLGSKQLPTADQPLRCKAPPDGACHKDGSEPNQ